MIFRGSLECVLIACSGCMDSGTEFFINDNSNYITTDINLFVSCLNTTYVHYNKTF